MDFILFDIEATCWDGYHSNAIQEIIELGAVAVNRYAEITGRYTRFVRPVINQRLSQYCRDLTGISQKDVDTALPFDEVYYEFEDWADAGVDTWFVSWGPFDQKIMSDECGRYFDHESLICNHLDLRSVYTTMKDLPPRTGLMKALEYEDMDFEGEQHRALPDTLNMERLFSRYFEYWDLNT